MPSAAYAEALLAPTGMAHAVLLGDEPVAAGGVVELWNGRGHAWALLSDEAGPHMLQITRATRRLLAAVPFRRVEMAVDAGFEQAVRWAWMLGFECETPQPMRGYTPDGRACYLFAMVR